MFFDTRNEKIAAGLTVVTMLAVALNAPPPRKSTVDGREISELIVSGYVIPDWLILIVAVPVLLLVHRLFARLLNQAWPEPLNETNRVSEQNGDGWVEVESVIETEDGGFVGWNPAIPGTPHPMEYTPPEFTARTTAEEFINATPPNAMRTLLGIDTIAEYEDFERRCRAWIDLASEDELRRLPEAAENHLLAWPDDHEMLFRLTEARDRRGVPSNEELLAFAERLENAELKALLTEDE